MSHPNDDMLAMQDAQDHCDPEWWKRNPPLCPMCAADMANYEKWVASGDAPNCGTFQPHGEVKLIRKTTGLDFGQALAAMRRGEWVVTNSTPNMGYRIHDGLIQCSIIGAEWYPCGIEAWKLLATNWRIVAKDGYEPGKTY
jgi:hypothetical protein